MFRIKGLAEKFVYFNDDMFINAPVKPEDFFIKGLPCASAVLNPGPANMGHGITKVALNDLEIIRKHFKFSAHFRHYWLKWLNLCYGKHLLKTILLLPFKHFTGFTEPHTANSFLKSTFIEVWEKESTILEETSSHRFRSDSDVNQWLMEYWQIAEGKFYPRGLKFSKRFTKDNLSEASKAIISGNYKVICINDNESIGREEFEELSSGIQKAYSEILPEKSSFEL